MRLVCMGHPPEVRSHGGLQAGDERMAQALTGFGFTDVSFVGRTGGQHRFDAAAEHRASCPCCEREHSSNDWWIRAEGGRYQLRNYSEQCRMVRIDGSGRLVVPAIGQHRLAGRLLDMAREHQLREEDIPVDGLRNEQVVEFRVRRIGADGYAVSAMCLRCVCVCVCVCASVGRVGSCDVTAVLCSDAAVDENAEEHDHECLACGSTHPSPGGRAYDLQQLAGGALDAWHMRDADMRCRGMIVSHTPAFLGAARAFSTDDSTSALADFFFDCHRTSVTSDDSGESVKVG